MDQASPTPTLLSEARPRTWSSITTTTPIGSSGGQAFLRDLERRPDHLIGSHQRTVPNG